jgi:hypothetical protein
MNNGCINKNGGTTRIVSQIPGGVICAYKNEPMEKVQKR